MDPNFDNCNIEEFDNSEKVLIDNANSQLDKKTDDLAEFYDENVEKPVKQTTKELLKQFNDGLNNFIQEKTNQTENILNNDFNNAFSNIETELIDRQNDFENEFLKNTDNDLNLQSQQISQNDNFDDNVASGIDITDDNAMQTTETSEATTNLLDDHSTLSNSKDTLSESPFDNRLPESNVNDAKSTPLISPNSEEVPHHDELNNDIEQNQDYLKLNGNGFNDPFSDSEKSFNERHEQDLGDFIQNSHQNFNDQLHEEEFNANLQEPFHNENLQNFNENSQDFHDNFQQDLNENLKDLNEHRQENIDHSQDFREISKSFNDNEQHFNDNSQDLNENPQIFNENIENLNENIENLNENLEDFNENLKDFCVKQHENPQDIHEYPQDIHEYPQNIHGNPSQEFHDNLRDIHANLQQDLHEEHFMNDSHLEENLSMDKLEDSTHENIIGSDIIQQNQIIDENIINLPELGEVGELQNYQKQYLDLEESMEKDILENNMKENEVYESTTNNTEGLEFPPEYDTIEDVAQQNIEIHKQNLFETQEYDQDDIEGNPFCQEINETQIQKQIINEVEQYPEQISDIEKSPLDEHHVDLNLQMKLEELPEKFELLENLTDKENNTENELNAEFQVQDNAGEQNSQMNVYQDNAETIDLKFNDHENEDNLVNQVENLMESNFNKEQLDENLNQNRQPLDTDPLQSTLEQIQSCDASEDEFNYMRLKEGDSEKNELKLNETDKENKDLIEKPIKIEEVHNNQFEIKSQESSNNLIPQEKNNQQQQKLVIDLNLQQDLDDDMNHQLNPEAKEFIPSSSPLEGNNAEPKFSLYNRLGDEVVSQSPSKNAVSNINMDEIQLPDEEQFDCEAEHRPHEFGIQQLNLKEATHAPEKELVSPINEEYLRGLDLHKQMSASALVGFHPIAEFENANMKDSIYIENPTSQETFEMERVENLMNSVQPIPQDILYGASGDYILEDNTGLNGSYDMNKEVLLEQNFENNLAMFEQNNIGTIIEQIIQDDPLAENIPQKLNIDVFHQTVPNIDGTLFQPDLNIGYPVQESSSETTTDLSANIPAGVTNEKSSAKVAEKNLKNKLDSAAKSGKVPETKKPILNRNAAGSRKPATEKPTTIASKVKPSSATATTEKVNKPKSITVATAAAPKTISFPRPRASSTLSKPSPSSSVASTTEKKSSASFERKVIERKPIASTHKLKVDGKSPPTLVIKKPAPSKFETKADAKSTTSSIRSASSKTGLISKSTVGAKAPPATIVPKPRPASANQPTTFSKTTMKPIVSTTRNTTQTKTSTIPKTASPRGTTVKSPTKPLSSTSSTLTKTTTTTTTTRVGGINKLRPSSATTTSSITKTSPARPAAGIVRKTTTTTTTTKQNNTLTPTKKPSPIKRPQTATPKLTTEILKDNDLSDVVTSVTTTTIIQQDVPIKEIEKLMISDELVNLQKVNDEPKLNGSHITTDEVTAV